MVRLDNLHPIQYLWMMRSSWVLLFLPPLPLPLPLPPLVRVSASEKEGRHSLLPGHLCDPVWRKALATDTNLLKCTLKEPGMSSKFVMDNAAARKSQRLYDRLIQVVLDSQVSNLVQQHAACMLWAKARVISLLELPGKKEPCCRELVVSRCKS